MSITATCPCGAEFKAKPELVGKRVKCPKCGQTFTVPRPQAASDVIRVTCGCGKALQAKPALAGKRVKCPVCGQSITIPSPVPMTDAPEPVQLDEDPLGLGDLGDDPLGFGANSTADSHGAVLPHMPSPTATTSRATRRKGTQDVLMTAAGWVAICFGGYQVLACAVSALRLLIAVVRFGTLMPLFGISPVLNILLLALGVWLGKLGFDIVRQQNSRESLERAAQASRSTSACSFSASCSVHSRW